MSNHSRIEVNGLIIDEEKIDYIISKVKANKSYSKINDDIIKEHLKRFAFDNFKLLKKDFDKLENSRFTRECVKYIRKELRKKSALYMTKKTRVLLERILESKKIDFDDIERILKSHISSVGRFEIYYELYEKIFSLIDKESKEIIRITDVGCGLNPFSYVFIQKEILKKCIFYAIDIDAEIVEAVKSFFEKHGIRGEALKRDAIDFAESIKERNERFDIVMLFRILEIIDEKGHKKAEKLIKDLDAELYVASFSRKTISGKRMTMQNQPWFERMMKRLGYEFSTMETENEIFYFCF